MSKNSSAKVSRRGAGLLSTVLFCCVVIGGYTEYQHWLQPLDKAVVIYLPSAQGGAENVLSTENLVAPKEENASLTETKSVSVPEPEVENRPVVDANVNALPEFLDYLRDVRSRQNAEISKEIILDKIKESSVKPAQKLEQKAFEENKIEVYDSQKGVVDVIETAPKKAEEKVEQAVKTPVEHTKQATKDMKQEVEKTKKIVEETKETVKEVTKSAEEPKVVIDEETKKAMSAVQNIATDNLVENVVPEKIEEKVQVVEKADNVEDVSTTANEDIEEIIKTEEKVEMSEEEKVRQRVNDDINQAAEDGEEAPVVLIPGM